MSSYDSRFTRCSLPGLLAKVCLLAASPIAPGVDANPHVPFTQVSRPNRPIRCIMDGLMDDDRGATRPLERGPRLSPVRTQARRGDKGVSNAFRTTSLSRCNDQGRPWTPNRFKHSRPSMGVRLCLGLFLCLRFGSWRGGHATCSQRTHLRLNTGLEIYVARADL